MTLIQRLLGRGRRTLAVAGLSVAALALAACGAGTDPLAEPSSGSSGGAGGAGSKIIVGSADFTESQILGELYAQAITAKGGDATTKPGIGSREVYIKALQDSSISVVPEYTGNLLLYFDGRHRDHRGGDRVALPAAVGSDLKILEPSRPRTRTCTW